MKMPEVLYIQKDCMELDSGLTEREFAHARLAQYMSEAGVLCIPETENGTRCWRTQEFRFTETRLDGKSKTVHICAPAFNGTSFISLLETALNFNEHTMPEAKYSKTDTKAEEPDIEDLKAQKKLCRALCAVCDALQYCLTGASNCAGHTAEAAINTDIVNCGPAGIVYGADGSVLFLPPSLCERSMLSKNERERAFLYGCWINKALGKTDGWNFSLASYAYTLLAGTIPFANTNDETRNEDYRDLAFVPLRFFVPVPEDGTNGTQNEITLNAVRRTIRAVDNNLAASVHTLKGKKGGAYAKTADTLHSSFLSADELQCTFDAVHAYKNDFPQAFYERKEKLQTKRAVFYTKQQKSVKHSRFLRKKSGILTVAALVILIAAFSAAGIGKAHKERPTTKGMNPTEVVHTFYTALHTLDTLTLDSCGKRGATKAYSNMAAALFVTGKMRQAYENIPSFLTPEQWLNVSNPFRFWVFGLTQLFIEELDISPTEAHIKAQFFIVTNSAPEQYQVTAYTDILTLTFFKNRWLITAINGESTDIAVDSAFFKKDVLQAFETYGIPAGIETLRNKYMWLPSKEALKNAAEKIQKNEAY